MRNACILHRTSAAFLTLCCVLIKEHRKSKLIVCINKIWIFECKLF